ncbi:hypothetical protein J2792_003298 [Novosphingobium capsulatum]|uniref:Uncharacterized protein n=1 Tax=Novosphingobium capsulatum TaxID=13688 RepID=A0ABU1MPY2_9SPHN|nr:MULTISPECIES: hypothetical protein [Novosphingobium]MDR6512415.1 hypothetical protein [Novosphingobium capsulatum]PTR09778.1 hypothetical protein C8K11_10869 [Novosphingobium sp. GV055]PUB02565.1 hypothetical protein C8K12_10869 [Novosphingobium sp. GV061]PUB19510.1 hypothetical protein C8K14_10869 [Novosphingobium sp. GV079]PUB40934.1 hypothetical protein C8K10_10869 [Novosphingobium sp. GV027]
MNIMKIAAIGAVASMLVAGTAQAAATRPVAPVAAVTAKKLARSSAPVAGQAKDVDGVVVGLAALAAFGVGTYEIVKKDNNPTPTVSTGS